MAKAIKTPKQPKEPVRVRYKTLSDGSQSVYLDIYRDGKRQYEFLKLYLIPDTLFPYTTLFRSRKSVV